MRSSGIAPWRRLGRRTLTRRSPENLSPRTLRRPSRRHIGIGLAFPNGPGRELDTCRGYDGGGAWPMERSQLGKVEYTADVNMECYEQNDMPKRR